MGHIEIFSFNEIICYHLDYNILSFIKVNRSSIISCMILTNKLDKSTRFIVSETFMYSYFSFFFFLH